MSRGEHGWDDVREHLEAIDEGWEAEQAVDALERPGLHGWADVADALRHDPDGPRLHPDVWEAAKQVLGLDQPLRRPLTDHELAEVDLCDALGWEWPDPRDDEE